MCLLVYVRVMFFISRIHLMHFSISVQIVLCFNIIILIKQYFLQYTLSLLFILFSFFFFYVYTSFLCCCAWFFCFPSFSFMSIPPFYVVVLGFLFFRFDFTFKVIGYTLVRSFILIFIIILFLIIVYLFRPNMYSCLRFEKRSFISFSIFIFLHGSIIIFFILILAFFVHCFQRFECTISPIISVYFFFHAFIIPNLSIGFLCIFRGCTFLMLCSYRIFMPPSILSISIFLHGSIFIFFIIIIAFFINCFRRFECTIFLITSVYFFFHGFIFLILSIGFHCIFRGCTFVMLCS